MDAGQEQLTPGRPSSLSTPADVLVVRDRVADETLTAIGQPDAAAVERAVQKARALADEPPASPLHVRADALRQVSTSISVRADELAEVITRESGKPLRYARVEVARASETFRWAAEAARAHAGEFRRLDTEPRLEGKVAIVDRVPLGVVLAITPFNAPLNLAAHKVAPAIAVGAPVLLKPDLRTPCTALALAEMFAATPLSEAALTVLPIDNNAAEQLVRDSRIDVLSYTGSDIGWRLKEITAAAHVVLELGGNAAVIVHADADLALAARRIVAGGYGGAGQSCISAQRVLVDRSVHAKLRDELVSQLESLAQGDPLDPATEVGPLIDEASARRAQALIDESLREGADLVVGGTRDGAHLRATLLDEAGPDTALWRREAFAPILGLWPYESLDEAFALANAIPMGLQHAMFTRSLDAAFRAHRELRAGGVWINEVSDVRADVLPYGGVGRSGVGREGVLAAMHEYTQPSVLMLSGLA